MSDFVNTAQAWRELDPAVQEWIGAAGMALMLGRLGQRYDSPGALTTYQVAVREVMKQSESLLSTFAPACFENGVPLPPDLNALKIPQCRECGMTRDYAIGCDCACEWSSAALDLHDDGAGQLAGVASGSREPLTHLGRFLPRLARSLDAVGHFFERAQWQWKRARFLSRYGRLMRGATR